MANFCVVTNNPSVIAAYDVVARPAGGDVGQVFATVRDAVHLGAALISHPLAGSLKPNECPYRSILLSTARGPVDQASLRIIEDAIAVLKKLPAKERRYSAAMLSDYQAIDLDLVRSAMQALPAAYHL